MHGTTANVLNAARLAMKIIPGAMTARNAQNVAPFDLAPIHGITANVPNAGRLVKRGMTGTAANVLDVEILVKRGMAGMAANVLDAENLAKRGMTGARTATCAHYAAISLRLYQC